MLIIRRIDMRSFLRSALPALVLANVPLLLVKVVDDLGYSLSFAPSWRLEDNRTQLINSVLLALAVNLLPVIAGMLLMVWVYNWLVRRGAGLGVVLRPAGSSVRLLRMGPKRAWGAGLLLAGGLALPGLALLFLPTGDVLRASLVSPLLNLNLAYRLLEDSQQSQLVLLFSVFYTWSQMSNDLVLQMALLEGMLLLIKATLAGGLLLWLGAILYNLLARSGGEFALRLRAARVDRESRSPGVTARLTGIRLPRTPRAVILMALALVAILLIGALTRELTPVMLLSTLRWPLALLLFNRLAPRAGGLIMDCESAAPVEGRAQGTG